MLLILLLSAGALLSARWLLNQPLQIEAETVVQVQAGDFPARVLRQLEQQNVLQGARWLGLYWRWRWNNPALHQGEYALKPDMSAHDLLSAWRQGDVLSYRVTLVDGWTFRQFRAALGSATKLENDIESLSDAALMQQLGAEGEHPEGRFAPDTYTYTWGFKASDVLLQAYSAQQQILHDAWTSRGKDLPYKEAYQALIMASIVERETGVPEERGEIAGVFVRRLKLGMLLQTDPTVIYGMGDAYQGRITRADLRKPTAYNTYVIKGLPPTPIAMPGKAAIIAALNPAEGKSLYFVARGDGSHQFSNSLAEHNRAVRQYQLKRRADYRSSPAARK
nr:endolytic transglycosylase MltG [Atopomonas sediminilitoris]